MKPSYNGTASDKNFFRRKKVPFKFGSYTILR